MEWIYFACALFVFLLVLAVVVLNDRLKRSRYSQDGEEIREKEKRLYTLYQNLEDLINGMEEYVEESKEDIKQVRDEVAAVLSEQKTLGAFGAKHRAATQHIHDTQKEETSCIQKAKGDETGPEQAKEPQIPGKMHKSVVSKMSVPDDIGTKRAARVHALFEQGHGIDEIAQEMSIARGEVRLILDVIKSKGG